jgi:biopolymer transport protein ExbD
MRFAAPPRPQPAERITPMINVVFLLLIFFLMTATLTPPEPVTVTRPDSRAADAPAEGTALHLDAGGAVAFGEATGAEAEAAAIAQARLSGAPLPLRADRAAEARAVAALVLRLARAGVARVALATIPAP